MNGVLGLQRAVTENPSLAKELAKDANSVRIGVVAHKLAMSAPKDDPQKFFHLCLSLARGIDFGVANNDPPEQASNLTPILKQVCCRKKEFYLLSGIMVLMISVKNACKLGWFNAQETEELLALADEVGSSFCMMTDINSETNVLMPTLSSVMSRYYPAYKLGHVIMSFEMKPGYAAYVKDFHITKDMQFTKNKRIRLLVALKDNVETSSCIINPQQVNILLNGRPVEKRTNVQMEAGPQVPTIVNQLLKYGTNLLQAVGQSNGNYIVVIAVMSTLQTSDLPSPEDYVRPDTILSGPDSEVIEGASRISLNCPISYRRIKTPTKGHLCKHYQCFDLGNYVEINTKRPSWRCPHCNQSVGFTDLRVDQMMVKILQEAGENVSEVTIDADGSWKVESSSGKDNSRDKPTNGQDENEPEEAFGKLDDQCNVFDLTGEDHEMDTNDGHEFMDTKPVVNHNPPVQSVFPNSTPPSTARNFSELFQQPFSQPQNGLPSSTPNHNMSSETLTNGMISGGNLAITPILTDAVSPSLNHLPNNFQGTNYPSSSNSLQSQGVFSGRSIPRNVTRVPSAIQALPVPTQSPHQNPRSVMSLPGPRGSSAPFQMAHVSTQQVSNVVGSIPGSRGVSQRPHVSTQQGTSNVGLSAERQRQIQQSRVDPLHGAILPSTPLMNCISSQQAQSHPWVHQPLSQPPHLMRPPHTLSQPPHLSRSSSQLSRHHPQQVVPTITPPNNSSGTLQRVQLTPTQTSQMRQHPVSSQPNFTPTPTQTPQMRQQPPQQQQHNLSRQNSSGNNAPLAVSRTESLFDNIQAEQAWRPLGRMRGALTGEQYSAALSQYMGSGTPTNTRPPVADSSEQILLANRMAARATQMPNRPNFDAGNNMDTTGGMQGDGSRGGN